MSARPRVAAAAPFAPIAPSPIRFGALDRTPSAVGGFVQVPDAQEHGDLEKRFTGLVNELRTRVVALETTDTTVAAQMNEQKKAAALLRKDVDALAAGLARLEALVEKHAAADARRDKVVDDAVLGLKQQLTANAEQLQAFNGAPVEKKMT